MSISALSFAATLFALTNPIGNMVLFNSLMQTYEKEQARKIALTIMLYTWIGMLITAAIGSSVLSFFSISIDAFALAGGLLLAKIGYTMTSGDTHKSSYNHSHKYDKNDDPSMIPLTIPLLLGPGTMVAIISYFSHLVTDINSFIISLVVITCTSGFIGACFYGSTYLPKLSMNVVYLSNRIMGLIVFSMGIELILHAIKHYF